jgi:hypothetical protein
MWCPRLYMCKGLYDVVVCPRLHMCKGLYTAKALYTLSGVSCYAVLV